MKLGYIASSLLLVNGVIRFFGRFLFDTAVAATCIVLIRHRAYARL